MALTKKEQARYRAITSQLAKLSSRGWSQATHVDWEPLEKELAALGDKLIAEPKTARKLRHPID